MLAGRQQRCGEAATVSRSGPGPSVLQFFGWSAAVRARAPAPPQTNLACQVVLRRLRRRPAISAAAGPSSERSGSVVSPQRPEPRRASTPCSPLTDPLRPWPSRRPLRALSAGLALHRASGRGRTAQRQPRVPPRPRRPTGDLGRPSRSPILSALPRPPALVQSLLAKPAACSEAASASMRAKNQTA